MVGEYIVVGCLEDVCDNVEEVQKCRGYYW